MGWNGCSAVAGKARDEGIRAKLPDSQVEFAEGVQIAKEFPFSFDGFIGPKIEKPWSPEEADRQMKSALKLDGSAVLTRRPRAGKCRMISCVKSGGRSIGAVYVYSFRPAPRR